jgi:hypothetical protein
MHVSFSIRKVMTQSCCHEKIVLPMVMFSMIFVRKVNHEKWRKMISRMAQLHLSLHFYSGYDEKAFALLQQQIRADSIEE